MTALAATESRQALPELLAELDERSFREELQRCCPSSYNLTSAELLTKFTDAMSMVEVISGFFADSKATGSVLSGMSVEDGMRGSYFQNAWEQILLHNKSFDAASYVFGFANRTDPSDDTHYTAWLWKNSFKAESRTCEDAVEWKLPVTIDKCIRVDEGNMTYGGSLNASGLLVSMWTDKPSLFHRRPLAGPGVAGWLPALPLASKLQGIEGNGSYVPCPSKAPQYEFVVPTQAGCHAIIFGSTDFFYQLQDRAETELYGLKPFAKPAHPATLQEASERGFYSLVNTMLFDAGSPLFGDVSAVFSSQAIKKTALVAAIDTGFQTLECNASFAGQAPAFNLPHNCSAVSYTNGSLGTLEHFYHLLLQNHRFWKPLPTASPLARMLARMEGSWGSNTLDTFDLISYLEIVPAGSLLFPNDIRFLIGTFTNLFGTAIGERLQEWAAKEGWMLLWSLGLNVEELTWLDAMDFRWLHTPSNRRLIDPIVAKNTSATKGLPLHSDALQEFQSHWDKVKALRAETKGRITNTTWQAEWDALVADIPSGLKIGPMRSGAGCPSPGENVPDCIGISSTGVCVCYERTFPVIFV